MKHLLLCAALCHGASSWAQYPIAVTGNVSLTTLQTVGSGVKFMDTYISATDGPGTRTVYDLDLSVDRVLNYPAPPAGMQWSGTMFYITESLFDTDASTIEYLMTASPNSGPGNFATFVFREDGTTLFMQNPGLLSGNIGTFMSSGAPIFTTPDGTFMMVHTNFVNGPPVNVYELPGSLPCMDCFGSPQADAIGTGQGISAEPFAGMSILPNPAQSELRVQFSERGMTADEVLVIDATGRVVLNSGRHQLEPLVMDVSGLANGRYTVVARSTGVAIGSLPFVIAR